MADSLVSEAWGLGQPGRERRRVSHDGTGGSDSSAGASRGGSIRQIQRETGLHFTPIKKILAQSSLPESQCPDLPQPKIGPHLERIREILQADENLPMKQRHTARRILERIREEGCPGSCSRSRRRCVAMPADPFDASWNSPTAAAQLFLVRFDLNDDSAPVRFAHPVHF